MNAIATSVDDSFQRMRDKLEAEKLRPNHAMDPYFYRSHLVHEQELEHRNKHAHEQHLRHNPESELSFSEYFLGAISVESRTLPDVSQCLEQDSLG